MFLIPVRIECCLGRLKLMLMFLIPVRIECCLGRIDVDIFDTC